MHAMWSEWRKVYNDNFLNRDPEARLEERLRILYGRGEISKERFHQLRFRLHGGLVSETDLSVIHQQAIRLMEARGNYLPQGDPELEHNLDCLYADRVRVEETTDQFKASIHALRGEVDWIKQQAEDAHQQASAALPDENAARAFLEVWQKLWSLSETLDNDLQAMERNLASLIALENEIKAAITRIKLSRSQQQLAGVNQRVLDDLLTPG
jgi:predicted  nucleic acid-binding Zn-ribbon protein